MPMSQFTRGFTRLLSTFRVTVAARNWLQEMVRLPLAAAIVALGLPVQSSFALRPSVQGVQGGLEEALHSTAGLEEEVEVVVKEKDLIPTDLKLSPTGHYMIVQNSLGFKRTKVWDMEVGAVVKRLGADNIQERARAIAFHPSEQQVAVARIDGVTLWMLWKPQQERPICQFGGEAGLAKAIFFTPKGNRFLSSALIDAIS